MVATVFCALMIAVFWTFALRAVHQKSAVWDENFHVLGAYSDLWLRDFRVDPDNFTLWKYWAALPDGPHGVVIDPANPLWNKLIESNWTSRDDWSITALYRTPGNDAEAILNRSRAMMLVIGVALIALLARWSYELGGAVAAIFATALITLDPNFLGHSPLVKNDVSAALAIFAAAYSTWRAGKRASLLNVACIMLSCGAAANIKASGFVVGPIVIFCLAIRALMPADWTFLHRILRTRLRRVLAVLTVTVALALSSYVIIWACYGFRFNATPNPAHSLAMDHLVAMDRVRLYQREQGGILPAQIAVNDCPIALSTKIAAFAEKHHILPQAWLYGLVYVSMGLRNRLYFLCGVSSQNGWWSYFPLGSLFKLPIATLACITILPALLLGRWVRARYRRTPIRRIGWQQYWSCICVIGVAAILFFFAMASRVNLGVRHIFPVYALTFTATGWIASVCWKAFGKWFRFVAVFFVGLLAFESISVYPDYIAFFNRGVGGSRGGIKLLADSNLDWGQDVKPLAAWAHAHPNTRILLCYTGLTDPAYYQLAYQPALYGYRLNRFQSPVTQDGVIAIDANSLQAWTADDKFRRSVQPFHNAKPIEVIGGTFYLFRLTFINGKASLDREGKL